jgi:hypothetical protein
MVPPDGETGKRFWTGLTPSNFSDYFGPIPVSIAIHQTNDMGNFPTLTIS